MRAGEAARGAWWPLAFGLALILGLLLVPPARAAEMTGRVVGIIDGDTIDVLMPGLQVVRVRLSGIDAPERGQAFGTAAKAALSELVFARQVVVQWKKRDRYERLVGKVTVSRVDANLAMLTRGWPGTTCASRRSKSSRIAPPMRRLSARRGRSVEACGVTRGLLRLVTIESLVCPDTTEYVLIEPLRLPRSNRVDSRAPG